MAIAKINIYKILTIALERKMDWSSYDYRNRITNLLRESFYGIERDCRKYLASEGKEYKDQIFTCYHKIIVCFMQIEGEFKQGEYDVYCDFCRAINRTPLSVSECETLYRENIDTHAVSAMAPFV